MEGGREERPFKRFFKFSDRSLEAWLPLPIERLTFEMASMRFIFSKSKGLGKPSFSERVIRTGSAGVTFVQAIAHAVPQAPPARLSQMANYRPMHTSLSRGVTSTVVTFFRNQLSLLTVCFRRSPTAELGAPTQWDDA